MTIELMRQFFTDSRTYRISDNMGRKAFADFSGDLLYYNSKALMFDIDVVIQRENPYSRESINKTVLELWQSGILNPQNRNEAVVALKNMQFDGKAQLITDLQSLTGKEDEEIEKDN